ncbi:hypothetical protein ACFWUW_18110 [Streptomyces sp. NPDC058655]|uniref:hypothetical protein n=1 Tax=unclassified Streptomyces TaxID=2593676 RepID=UPI003669DD12
MPSTSSRPSLAAAITAGALALSTLLGTAAAHADTTPATPPPATGTTTGQNPDDLGWQ